MLTIEERMLLDDISELMHGFREIMGKDLEIAEHDWEEIGFYIHGLQNIVLSQSAAREYPREYRLLGEVFESSNSGDNGDSD